MPQETSAQRSPKASSKKSTSRYSLNVLGKALADVMNKDTKGTASERASKKPRDSTTSARRMSAATAASNTTVRRRGSFGERPPAKEDAFSPGETITRSSRRHSALLKDATSPPSAIPAKAAASLSPTIPTRRSTLRPRTLGNASALPKYRPKSVLVESSKAPPSPPRLGTRKRVSSSDDEKEPGDIPKKHSSKGSVSQRAARPISPLPLRALQGRTTPPPNKADRNSKPSTPTRSGIPRPPSSTSSSGSLPTPRTPTHQSARSKTATPNKCGPSLRSPTRKLPESPLSKFSKRDSIPKIVKVDQLGQSTSGSSSGFTEGDSADDIEFMLGSVVSPTAPTPALPRIRDRSRLEGLPQTPTRTSGLPSRANLSYLSPLPPPANASPSIRMLRAGQDRGSLLSWDQLVAVGDRTLGEGEVDSMIADMPAPFSPAPSTVDLESAVPESPSLSALPSPIGYGAISQVLLPDVTPSPAPAKHMHSQFTPERGAPAADASLAMMLRLQLASMENIAKERLGQITALEAQLDAAKHARLREASDLAAQVTALEEQMCASLETRQRAAEDRMVLEEQLRGAAAARELAVQEAVKMAVNDAMRLKVDAEEAMRHRCATADAARTATAAWTSVRDVAEGELELVRAQRETLNVLLASLDQSRQLCTVKRRA
ncbi:hypothetical protein BC834DRAFT_965343 [Gloeopeniophorella convolvens]|nr:hypothetical protein BC834DRAFT_965343 [Gloeopeniophorella convolvens]